MLVKFITHSDIYMPGEVAGFPDELAARLIAAGAAVPLTAAAETAAAPPEETPVPLQETALPMEEVPAAEPAPPRRRGR